METKVPYFAVCATCDRNFAKHVSTIDICKMCFDRITSDLWGMGVPTE